MCPSVTGLLMHARAVLQRGFYPALERAGIRRVRYHDLRHSWASNLLEAGANLADVSRDLGHANVYITLKIYTPGRPKGRAKRLSCRFVESWNFQGPQTLPNSRNKKALLKTGGPFISGGETGIRTLEHL